ncbi:hypothetical protein FF38_06978 [Lucilia cuprina]|uniref:Uncharacterized protein n=1 Tax=Lucilia cuprina TaxID=7375 RepID=A0A0L0CKL2_LUCCU|nr:hypothetical protein FF38_06978 [Lucilia cuprina]
MGFNRASDNLVLRLACCPQDFSALICPIPNEFDNSLFEQTGFLNPVGISYRSVKDRESHILGKFFGAVANSTGYIETLLYQMCLYVLLPKRQSHLSSVVASISPDVEVGLSFYCFRPVIAFSLSGCACEPMQPVIPQRGYYGKRLDSSTTSAKVDRCQVYPVDEKDHREIWPSRQDSGAMVDHCQMYPVDEKDRRGANWSKAVIRHVIDEYCVTLECYTQSSEVPDRIPDIETLKH